METKYPNLKRPRRKLCYVADKESAPKKWAGVVTLEDVDKMFDDIDDAGLHPPSTLFQSTDSNQSETTISPDPQEKRSKEKLQDQNGPGGDVPQPAWKSSSRKVDNDLDIPFKAHGPVKTSSPIELIMGAASVEVQDNEKDEIVSPILFNFEDEVAGEPNTAPVPTDKPSLSGEITVGHDGELESPRCRIVLTKLSTHKKMPEAACGDKNTKLPVAKVSRKPELSASTGRKNLEAARRQPAAEGSSRTGKDVNSFLETLKQSIQSNPRRTWKSPVKVPSLPLPPPSPPHQAEDDFLILEDDCLFQFSIPSKSTDKDSSTDKKTNDRPRESPQERQKLEKANGKQGGRAVNQKIKKKKDNNPDLITPDVMDDLNNHLVPPAGDLFGDQKLTKKKQLKKAPSKERDEVEQPEDIADEVTEKEKLSRKIETKARKIPTKRKTSKENKKSTKTIKANRLKETTEQIQEPDAVKEATHVGAVGEQRQEQSDTEPAETEDLGSFTEREIIKAPEANGKTKRKKHPAVSGGTFSEDTEVLVKRQRKQTGPWWMSGPHSIEEPEIQQPTVKKSKQNNTEPSTAVLSPGKAKKDKVYKNQKRPVTSTEPKNKEKKTKQSRKRNARGAVPDEIKATDDIVHAGEAEQIFDPNLDQEHSSPMVFTHRDHSLNSGRELFQRVYHHTPSEKVSTTPAAPVSPRKAKEQLREAEEGKRRRNPPGNWWESNVSDNSESSALPAEQLKRKGTKAQQQRRKQSKKRNSARLGIPKNGKVAIPSIPAGGAPRSPRLSAPKTVKRSLATFKDIFSSAVEGLTVVSSRGAHQSGRSNAPSHPAGKGSSKTHRQTDSNVFNGDSDECSSTQHNVDECQSENRSKVFRSGPSSMIELEQHEDDDDGTVLPSSRVCAVLSESDLCAPPLMPLTLHPNDKTNLSEWFQTLWSTTSDEGVAISPDQFDWYSYQNRALGFQVDLNSGSICSGKIVMGSNMKKPLWVDHSATTVFNLLTSSVSVIVDGCVSRYRPGQAFMVECGRAYSIQNTNALPAVLHFTRILAVNSD
ncbi:uncharacterized protein si:ch211-161h7.4 isoform X2 [Cololabis saira]|uniref:uncharacterized protein si:ch211-161h7.4 isoform X2 n=1 Tax=Cololabis saira TaxID=129043 RepID=UPI002AD2D1E7|nr:uncharacterized protein si:ch211-161h7.4 isoform X2 [Cololabis saira]